MLVYINIFTIPQEKKNISNISFQLI